MFLLLVAAGFVSATAAEPMNVIVVMTDDQGYGDLSCHGNPVIRTPHLDQLHAESIRFTDFHVAPMCTPTRGQLMSGVDAFRNGAMNVSSGRTLLRQGLPTMADVFSASGYSTGIFGKWHLGDNYPFRPEDRGFQEALWFPSSHISAVPDYWNNDYFDDTYYHNGSRESYFGYCTDVFFSEAMRWMQKQSDAGQPFFTYIPLNCPHGPHFVPDHYRTAVRERLNAALPNLPELNAARQKSLVSFLAMIENIDENMGRLEQFLSSGNLKDNTLLIYLTDNGSTMGPRYYNAGMKGGKVTLWEGGHRVPLFVRWPGGPSAQPRDISELCHVQDLLPTLIDVCELKQPANAAFDGVSLGGLLRGSQDHLDDRMLVVNYSRMPFRVTRPTADHGGTPRKEGAAVLWKRWRLLEDKMLFDLETDPRQDTNVIEQHPEVAARMREHLNEWWDGVKSTVNEPSRVVIGADDENPTMLTACEWFDVFVDQQRQVRRADPKIGYWYLNVDQPGTYTFELRRYPRESGLAITQAIPATKVTDGVLVAGRELPVAKAHLQIASFDQTVDVQADAQAVTFEVTLPAGPVTLKTRFLDADDKELCGAYFAYVRRD
jgi:arylsulfatase